MHKINTMFSILKNIFILILLLNIDILSQDTLKFAFISDIHFGKTEFNTEKLYPAEWLSKALVEINNQKPAFIFLGGDIIETYNSSSQYAQFDSVMQTDIPWYPMAGNHDIGGDSSLQASINNWINRGYGRGKYNREFYGFTFIQSATFYVLNTQLFHSSDPEIQKRSEIQLVECDSFFNGNSNIPVKIILSHVPLFTKTLSEDDKYFNINKSCRKRLLDIMIKHNVKYYAAGHQHINNEVTEEGITVFMNTALSFQLGTGNKRGYYIYSITGDKCIRHFYPL